LISRNFFIYKQLDCDPRIKFCIVRGNTDPAAQIANSARIAMTRALSTLGVRKGPSTASGSATEQTLSQQGAATRLSAVSRQPSQLFSDGRSGGSTVVSRTILPSLKTVTYPEVSMALLRAITAALRSASNADAESDPSGPFEVVSFLCCVTMRSALMKVRQLASFGWYSNAKDVFPAPLGPATINTVFMLGVTPDLPAGFRRPVSEGTCGRTCSGSHAPNGQSPERTAYSYHSRPRRCEADDDEI